MTELCDEKILNIRCNASRISEQLHTSYWHDRNIHSHTQARNINWRISFLFQTLHCKGGVDILVCNFAWGSRKANQQLLSRIERKGLLGIWLSLKFLRSEEPRTWGVIKQRGVRRTRYDTTLRELIVVKGWIVNCTRETTGRHSYRLWL